MAPIPSTLESTAAPTAQGPCVGPDHVRSRVLGSLRCRGLRWTGQRVAENAAAGAVTLG